MHSLAVVWRKDVHHRGVINSINDYSYTRLFIHDTTHTEEPSFTSQKIRRSFFSFKLNKYMLWFSAGGIIQETSSFKWMQSAIDNSGNLSFKYRSVERFSRNYVLSEEVCHHGKSSWGWESTVILQLLSRAPIKCVQWLLLSSHWYEK